MSNRERLKLYSLEGPAAEFAVAAGLTEGDWYRTDVSRSRMKELMRRSDAPAIRDTALWIGIALVAARGDRPVGHVVGCALLPGLRRALRLVVRQPLARMRPWHSVQDALDEQCRLSHRLFHDLREADVWRWSHTRHHTDTIIVGRDPEIAAPRPPDSPASC